MWGMPLTEQIVALFLLAMPVASIAWTVTHEDIFREWQDYCRDRSDKSRTLLVRKLSYAWHCEYCMSHYVAVVVLLITRFKLLFDDWRGYVIVGFALVWIANQYLSIYARLRLDIRRERVEIKGAEQEVKKKVQEAPKRAA
jgi:hypothetical protein